MGNPSGWTEGILLSLVFVAVIGIIIGSMNSWYGQSYSLGLSDNETEQLFIDYQDSSEQKIQGGEVEFDASQGVTLKSSYGLVTDILSVIWNFLTGGWIESLFSLLGAGASGMALARALRILYFLSLVFALLYALFKIKL